MHLAKSLNRRGSTSVRYLANVFDREKNRCPKSTSVGRHKWIKRLVNSLATRNNEPARNHQRLVCATCLAVFLPEKAAKKKVHMPELLLLRTHQRKRPFDGSVKFSYFPDHSRCARWRRVVRRRVAQGDTFHFFYLFLNNAACIFQVTSGYPLQS